MIPDLTREGQLPPGIHEATSGEVRRRFGRASAARMRLMKGISVVIALAKRAGAKALYINGSFVTDKKDPGDWDGVLVFPVGANPGSEDAVALADRERMKWEHEADLFTVMEDDREVLHHFLKDIFGTDRRGRPKGLVKIRLKGREEAGGTD